METGGRAVKGLYNCPVRFTVSWGYLLWLLLLLLLLLRLLLSRFLFSSYLLLHVGLEFRRQGIWPYSGTPTGFEPPCESLDLVVLRRKIERHYLDCREQTENVNGKGHVQLLAVASREPHPASCVGLASAPPSP